MDGPLLTDWHQLTRLQAYFHRGMEGVARTTIRERVREQLTALPPALRALAPALPSAVVVGPKVVAAAAADDERMRDGAAPAEARGE